MGNFELKFLLAMVEYIFYLNIYFFLFSLHSKSIKKALKNERQFSTARSIKERLDVRELKMQH
jgi:hypothetical protein